MRRREFVRFVPFVLLKVTALAVAVGLFAPPGIETGAAQGAVPFAGLQGNWSGGGTITLASGSHERLAAGRPTRRRGRTLALRLRLRATATI